MRKKLLFVLGALCLFIAFGGNQQLLFTRSSIPEKIPVSERSEIFRLISLRFYGTDEYADELELINKSFRFKKSGFIKLDDLIIPAKESIHQFSEVQNKKTSADKSSSLPINKNILALIPSFISLILLLLNLNQLLLPAVIGFVVLFLIFRIYRGFKSGLSRTSREDFENQVITSNDDRILVEFDVTQLKIQQKERSK